MQQISAFFLVVLASGALAGSLGSNDFLINWLAQEEDTSIRVDAFVEVKNGTLKGFSKILPSGRTVYSFKKIPFAKPPVGELRFEVILPEYLFLYAQTITQNVESILVLATATTGGWLGRWGVRCFSATTILSAAFDRPLTS